MENPQGKLISVNVGGIREFEFSGKPAKSAIWKSSVEGRVAARGVNLAGDDQADRAAHGGPDKAIYAYAIEDYRWWESELKRKLEHGIFGENLTTEGLDVTNALVGERWKVGSVLLEVSEPRVPCWRLGVRMEDKLFVRTFTQAGRPGTYLRIVEEGELGAGDEIQVVSRPDHDLSIGDIFRIFSRDRKEVERLLPVAPLSDAWKQWAAKIVEKKAGSERKSPSCCG